MLEPFASASPVRRSVATTLDSFRVERRLDFAHGYVEERRYLWRRPLEDVVTLVDDLVVLNMALTPRPAPMRMARLDPGGGEPQDIGRILLIRPGETVRFTGPTGQLRSMLCALDRRKFEEILGEDPDWEARLHELGPQAPGAEIERLLNRIYEELRRDRFAREVAIDGYALALCVELARLLRPGGPRRARKGGLAPWRMQILRDRTHADAPAPRVEELAQLCGMTVRQLSRAFKAETGITIGRFVDEATAERAIRLLTTTGRSVKEIAAELGYASSASFACAFRRSTGVLPTQVRQRL